MLAGQHVLDTRIGMHQDAMQQKERHVRVIAAAEGPFVESTWKKL